MLGSSLCCGKTRNDSVFFDSFEFPEKENLLVNKRRQLVSTCNGMCAPLNSLLEESVWQMLSSVILISNYCIYMY